MATAQLPVAEDSTSNMITRTCEKLITQTQTDLEVFRHEQDQLREQILDILQENQNLNTKLEVLKSSATSGAGESRDDATREQLTKDALKNVQLQIEYLQAENKELRLLGKSSRKTVQSLQEEIENYRIQLFQPNSIEEVKQKYSTTIKLLECTITSQKSELAKQGQILEKLFHQKKELRESLQQTQEALKAKNLQESNGFSNNAMVLKLQEEIAELLNEKKDLEKSLKLSKRVIEERLIREKRALQKVQEALSIAETAVTDKENAQKREQVVKEECDNLASTIGVIMEEAAQKVDKDMDALKKAFADKEKVLLDREEKLNEDLLNHRKFNEIVETRCTRIELKYKEMVLQNEKLTKDLQKALQTLGDMELKLASSEQLILADKQVQVLAKEREKEIQQYIQTYKQSKEKYKVAMEDVTQKFETEIYRLQNENANLKAENRDLKVSKNDNPPKDLE